MKLFSRALILLLSSWATVQVGVYLGHRYLPESDGAVETRAITPHDLFRFDSVYYLKIAEEGYRYNSDPMSSPNLVFAPMFPLLVRAVSVVPVDLVLSGLILNKLLLLASFVILLVLLEEMIGGARAFWCLFAMGTAAGAYALHAFYSEATMLFLLSLSLLSYQRRWRWTLALSALALGASRLTAAPIALAIAVLFARAAWANRKVPAQMARDLLCAVLAIAGFAAYLGYIALEFGNPFTLLPEIQAASWGRFHPPTDLLKLLTLGYFADYWSQVPTRSPLDIRTLNLIWTSLAACASVYLVWAWRGTLFAFAFLVYFLFIYCTNSSSEYLISAHRFFTLMLPIYLMFASGLGRLRPRRLAQALAAVLLFCNAVFGVYHATLFNQGFWSYF